MSTRSLPPRPSLAQLKIQANELRQAHRDRQASAAARIAAHHPRFKGRSPQAVLEAPFALADAQLAVAREYGFDSWPKLKQYVELSDVVARFTPHPRFDEAVAAMDAGDLERLRRVIASDPALVRARTNLEPPYHYFTGATLLHHVAGNPDRGRLDGRLPPLPANSAEIARLLLDAGADVHALTLGPHGGDTMGLVLTSKQASDANVAGPLIDVLLARGVKLDLTSDTALDASLANHAPRAAEKLIALGAKPDLLAAAALGRLDLLRAFFDDEGRLLSRPRRNGKEMTDRDAIGLALLYAYVREQREAVDFLIEKDGNWDMTGVNNGAALHRAAFAGDRAMVQRLMARGASMSNRDNPFWSSPLGWADHSNQTEVIRWMREHAVIDLHDAVAFGWREHAEARLRENPASVNVRIDRGDIPQGTPLHWAADQNRIELAQLLIEKGADVNAVAGNGYTPLDVADFMGAAGVAALLERHGGTRAIVAKRDSIPAQPAKKTAPALYRVDETHNTIRVQRIVSEADWDAIFAVMVEKKITGLDANGQMTDRALERVAELEHIAHLHLGGSRISDAGVATLRVCEHLESVDLLGTPTGDGAIEALAGKSTPPARQVRQKRHRRRPRSVHVVSRCSRRGGAATRRTDSCDSTPIPRISSCNQPRRSAERVSTASSGSTDSLR